MVVLCSSDATVVKEEKKGVVMAARLEKVCEW